MHEVKPFQCYTNKQFCSICSEYNARITLQHIIYHTPDYRCVWALTGIEESNNKKKKWTTMEAWTDAPASPTIANGREVKKRAFPSEEINVHFLRSVWMEAHATWGANSGRAVEATQQGRSTVNTPHEGCTYSPPSLVTPSATALRWTVLLPSHYQQHCSIINGLREQPITLAT